MKTYIFRTTTTMKEYNSKHWWIDGNIIPEKTIPAESVAAALEEYRELVEYDNCISISKVEALKDQIKKKMTAAGVDTLVGAEHKATYKAVTNSRVDTTALKKDLPDVAARYTKTTETRRFTFA